jgi:hypothetical protein
VRLPLGEWLPDLPPIANQQGLMVAKNVVPIQIGYGPQKSLAALADFTPLAETPKGSHSLIDSEGNPINFAGTETLLYALDNFATRDASRTTGGAYNCTGTARWEFSTFGELTIAVNPYDDPQVYRHGVLTEFERLSADAPRARHCGVVGNHVVFGNLFDPIWGGVPNSIWWPAIGDPTNWPQPGTDAAVQVQSDRQPLEGEGGWVQRVIGGAEVGAVFQEKAVWRMDYRGGDQIYELNRVEPNRGLLIPGSAVAVSRWIFYVSEDGFYLFDYTASQPIGEEKLNRYFLADVDSEYFHRITARQDPKRPLIYLLYPGSGNSAGTPNRWICYNYKLNRFTHGDLDAEILAYAIAPGPTLDSPDTPEDPDEIDATPELPAFDERVATSADIQLGAFDLSDQLAAFTGANMLGTLETGHVEVNAGYRSLVTGARPIVDGAEPTMQVAGLGRAKAPVSFGRASKLEEDGACPLRSDARYHRFRLNLPTDFENAIAVDIEAVRTGRR